MKLSEQLHLESVRIPLHSKTKEEVLLELVSLLPSASNPDVRQELLEAVLEREKRMSTGIGQGIAIPHGKSDKVAGMEIALGVAPEPIDFAALDGEPVRIFFLLISPPEATGPHIKALALISRMLSADSLRDHLADASSPAEALEKLAREESDLGE